MDNFDNGYFVTHKEIYTFSQKGESQAFKMVKSLMNRGIPVIIESTTVGTKVEYQETYFVENTEPFGNSEHVKEESCRRLPI